MSPNITGPGVDQLEHRADPSPDRADPLDGLLRRLAEGAESPRVRSWAEQLLTGVSGGEG